MIGLCFDPADHLRTGQSKLGGMPDLPKELSYPKNSKGLDIPFLCQLNLKEFENELAPEGILYFFCQLDDTTEYGAVLFSPEVDFAERTHDVRNEFAQPISERAITFMSLSEVSEDSEDYYKVMGRSRVGGSVFKAGANYVKSGRVSLLQINTNEIEELQGEVEEFIHFFIDLPDLISLNFDSVFVTSQH
jgi:uncharacterized protein YwqG